MGGRDRITNRLCSQCVVIRCWFWSPLQLPNTDQVIGIKDTWCFGLSNHWPLLQTSRTMHAYPLCCISRMDFQLDHQPHFVQLLITLWHPWKLLGPDMDEQALSAWKSPLACLGRCYIENFTFSDLQIVTLGSRYNCLHLLDFATAELHPEKFLDAYLHPEKPVDWDDLYDGFDAAVDW